MALQVGDAACTVGLSLRIYSAITGGASTGLSSPLTAAQQNALKALCYGIAVGVVGEIQTNASVSVNVTAPTNAYGAGIPAAPVVTSGTGGVT